MNKKRTFLERLFGGSPSGCDCGMEIAEEKPQKAGCCNMQIVEEAEQSCCGESSADKSNEGSGHTLKQ